MRIRILCLSVVGLLLPLAAGAASLLPGDLVVSTSNQLHRVDATTGERTLIWEDADQRLTDFAVTGKGRIVASTATSLIEIDAMTGSSSAISSGGLLTKLTGVTVAPDGTVFALNGSPGRGVSPNVIRVDAGTGTQAVHSDGGLFEYPAPGFFFEGVDLELSPSGNPVVLASDAFEFDRVFSVDASSGAQSLIAGGGASDLLVGLGVGADGDVFASQTSTTLAGVFEADTSVLTRIDVEISFNVTTPFSPEPTCCGEWDMFDVVDHPSGALFITRVASIGGGGPASPSYDTVSLPEDRLGLIRYDPVTGAQDNRFALFDPDSFFPGEIQVVPETAIPEPTAVLLFAAGWATLGLRRRRAAA